MSISKNSNFFVSARMHRAENLSVHALHEGLSTELPKVGALRRRGNRGKSAFLEVL